MLTQKQRLEGKKILAKIQYKLLLISAEEGIAENVKGLCVEASDLLYKLQEILGIEKG